MPIERTGLFGALSSGAAATISHFPLPVGNVGAFSIPAVDVPDCPRLVFYLLWTTAGGAAPTFVPEFSVDDTAVAGAVTQLWFPLALAGALLSGVPVLLNYTMPARSVRVTFGGLVVTETVDIVYGGTM